MKKVYLDELENIGNELINYSINNIGNKIQDLKSATNNLVWQGPAYNSYITGYNTRINELIKMGNNMTNLAKFLLTVRDGYNDTNKKIENAYDELVDEFKRMRRIK